MAKSHKLRKFDRTSTHRDSMIRNLAISLVHYEVVTTTAAKAKVVRSYFEKMINRAKKGDETAKRYLSSITNDKLAVQKITEVLIPRYAARTGGYISIKRVGIRPTDSSNMVEISLVDGKKVLNIPNPERQAKRAAAQKRAASKKSEATKQSKKVSVKAIKSTKPEVATKKSKASKPKQQKLVEKAETTDTKQEDKQSFTARLGKFLGLKNRNTVRPEDEK